MFLVLLVRGNHSALERIGKLQITKHNGVGSNLEHLSLPGLRSFENAATIPSTFDRDHDKSKINPLFLFRPFNFSTFKAILQKAKETWVMIRQLSSDVLSISSERSGEERMLLFLLLSVTLSANFLFLLLRSRSAGAAAFQCND
jgi:hypothetical protein